MYSYGYSSSPDFLTMLGLENIKTAAIVILIISLLGAIALSIYFLNQKRYDESVVQPVKHWFFRFFNFDKYIISGVTKFLYFFMTIFAICLSFVLMVESDFGTGLGVLLLGPLAIRLVYELTYIILAIRDKLDSIDRTAKDIRNGCEDSAPARPAAPARHAAPVTPAAAPAAAPAPRPAAPQAAPRRFCPKCGAEVKPGAPFCTNCGAKMN